MKAFRADRAIILVSLLAIFFAGGLYLGRRSASSVPSAAAVVSDRGGAEETAAAEAKLNVNTASAEALSRLPGIGATLAARIVAYRETHGPFSSVDDLTAVSGVGEGKLDEIRDRITAGE